MNVILPFELTNGNEGRQKNWYTPARIRKTFERDLLTLGMRRRPFEYPVQVVVTRILGKGQRLWDSSSIGRGNYKELEDALVAVGWFHDDGSKWIAETRFFQDASRRDLGPCVEIQTTRSERT